MRVLYANSEAVRILAYPGAPATHRTLDTYVAKKLRDHLENCRPSPTQSAVTELRSGRRRYLCHTFALGRDGYFTADSFHPSIAAVIERGNRVLSEVAQVGDQFHLTPREREAMALLLHGLTSKQIAARMKVSPNTVKAFLRLVMMRMGVSNRSAVVGKILASAF